ncbi:MAG: hypothetical protein QG670_1155 [Thermoproteota archaeon]|nr:hypothetical protein [Thermoproteota archaeon]
MTGLLERKEVVELAKMYASKRFLCSESVLLAVSDWLGVKSELIPKIATGLGAGIGGRGTICGALSGGVIALGLVFGRKDPVIEEGRRPYWFAQELFKQFKEKFGSVMCADITGCDISTEEGRKSYSEKKMWDTKCSQCIQEATGIVMEIIVKNSIAKS